MIRYAKAVVLAWLVVVSLLVSACGVPDEALTGTPEPGFAADPAGKILFVADGRVQLWDGDVSQVTDDTNAASPTWAPAGDRFAYIVKHDGFSELVVADRDGNGLVQVTNNEPADEPFSPEYALNAAWALDPIWSPAGEQIIFVSDKGGLDPYSDPLYLWYSETWDAPPYPLDASLSLGITQENPTLSSDGNRVAFVVRNEESDLNRFPEIWTLDLNSGRSDVLVSHEGGAYDPAWSPDDLNIAFVRRDGTSNDVWIAPTNDGVSYRLTSVGSCVSPVWSPDGRFLAFFRERDGNFEAWYVELSGDPAGQLTASEPRKLFDADRIDTTSGMSWINK